MEKVQITVTVVAVVVASVVVNYLRNIKKIGYIPGMRCLFSPVSPFGASIPTCRFNPGINWQWLWRKTAYAHAGTDTISIVPCLSGEPVIYTRSLNVARQVLSTKGDFYKAPETVSPTLVWGPNIFAANGDDWRRHRRVITPAFSNETYESVWTETARVFDEMVTDQGWRGTDVVELAEVNTLTNKLAMIIIATCGFGYRLDWRFAESSSESLSFGDALQVISQTHILRILLPKWAYWLPVKKFREMDVAFKSLLVFMQGLIETRRKEFAAGTFPENNILSIMIKSNENENGLTMDDSELIGNTFLLLSAGHDTTARTLDAALGFLALNESFQKECYEELMDIMPADTDLTLDNSSRLTRIRACFLETARLFPAGFMLIRDTHEDLVLRNTGPKEDTLLPLKRGTRIVVDVVGMHYNDKLFPDPESFKPERWYDVHENNASMFSVGPRACIGRRFAIVEATCFLAKLLRGWKVEILANQGETKHEWQKRVMRGQVILNFGVGKIPVRLVKRG